MDFNTNQEINNRYRLIKPIGRGSFGEVWLAEDKNLGFNVALKIYVALDNKGLEEFKNEFKNVYYLHHPNLLKADYYDTIGNNPYLVMQYCPESTGDLAGNMSEAEIRKFIKDVASGLAYLHSNDIVHRDIKPDNILKDSMGNYVITDFGLSIKMRSTLRKASGRFNNTADQSGTVGYMAPEMFAAKPDIVKATDVWALGVTIYELATGELPFCGQGGVMELHGAELPILPDQYSKELNDLMKRCLAKDAWDRPTAQTIVNQLSSPTPKEKVTTNSSDKNASNAKKSKEWTWIWILVFLFIIAIILGLNSFNNKLSTADSDNAITEEIVPEDTVTVVVDETKPDEAELKGTEADPKQQYRAEILDLIKSGGTLSQCRNHRGWDYLSSVEKRNIEVILSIDNKYKPMVTPMGKKMLISLKSKIQAIKSFKDIEYIYRVIERISAEEERELRLIEDEEQIQSIRRDYDNKDEDSYVVAAPDTIVNQVSTGYDLRIIGEPDYNFSPNYANTYGYQVADPVNQDQWTALVIVDTDLMGLQMNAGSLIIVARKEKPTQNQVWFYVQPGAKSLQFFSKGYTSPDKMKIRPLKPATTCFIKLTH
jgi:serine/threonine protein kinase